MDLTLTRNSCDATGCFGTLTDIYGRVVCITAEHSYQDQSGIWAPKVPVGVYTCQRGQHQLSVGPVFETYQVMDVPGHTGILIHKGNLPETDSEGCILLGTVLGTLENDAAVLYSLVAFDTFMTVENGALEFQLTVQ